MVRLKWYGWLFIAVALWAVFIICYETYMMNTDPCRMVDIQCSNRYIRQIPGYENVACDYEKFKKTYDACAAQNFSTKKILGGYL